MAAGVIGGAVALGATAAIHTVAPRVPFPPIAVAEALVEATPGGVATFFVDRLQHLALPIMVVATTACFVGASAWLGRLLPRVAARLGGNLLATAAVLGSPLYAIAVLALHPDSQTVGRATYAALLLPVFAVSAWTTARRSTRLAGGSVAGSTSFDPARRELIRGLWVGAVGLAVGWTDLGRLVFRRPDPGRLPLRIHELAPASPPSPAPGDATFERITALSPEVTRNEDFYVVDKEIIDPDVDPDAWALSIGGLVDRPYALTYDELLDLPAVEQFETLECISNRVGGSLISTSKWTGIPLRDILARAGVRDGAIEVVSTAVGGYSDSIAISRAMQPSTLVAIGMNGRTLPRAHGFPARLLTPGLYGMKQPKWLESIEVVDRPHTGYWELRGWSKAAVVQTMSRIDGVDRDQDPFVVGGVAFAGDRGISKVEVSTDGGTTWNDAELRRPLSPFTWRLWRFPLELSSEGPVRILARATDGEGKAQTREIAPPHPSGATGYHELEVT